MQYKLEDEVLLFATAAMTAGYRCEVRKRGVQFHSPAGVRVGKWNAFRKHWVVYKGIAVGHEELLKGLGFRRRARTMYERTHRSWQLDGADEVNAFQRACEKLTDVDISTVTFR